MNFIPWQIRDGVKGLIALPKRISASTNRSMRKFELPTGRPVVSFGGVLDGLKIVHGGRVKLLGLQAAFETSEQHFNILYLVSSALPPFCVDLAKFYKKKGVKIVWNQNGVAYPAWAGAETERYNRPMRQMLELADYVVYQSRFCKRSADKFLKHYDGPHMVLFNPVHTEDFRPRLPPLPHVPLRLLCIGTHSYPERVIHPIRALAILRRKGLDAVLTIAGCFEWRNALKQIKAEMKRYNVEDLIEIRPPFERDAAVEIYQNHHVLIHPKYMDPCPTVVLEAMACGLPVIGSASGGMPELVARSCGVLIEAPVTWDRMITPSPEGLAEGVLALIPKFDDHARSARQHAEKLFELGVWVERHCEIFDHLLGIE